jgi:hypothetical protein
MFLAVILTVYSGLEFGVTQFGATRRNPN